MSILRNIKSYCGPVKPYGVDNSVKVSTNLIKRLVATAQNVVLTSISNSPQGILLQVCWVFITEIC